MKLLGMRKQKEHTRCLLQNTLRFHELSNISRAMAAMFIRMCPRCATHKIISVINMQRKPIISETFNDREQIDLIDVQSCPDGPFRWILHYQDHLTKFSYLRAIRKKSN